jgi:talin
MKYVHLIEFSSFINKIFSFPFQQLQQSRVSTILTEPQRALIGYISAGQEAISKAARDLESKAPLPPLGTDPGSLQWREVTLETSK